MTSLSPRNRGVLYAEVCRGAPRLVGCTGALREHRERSNPDAVRVTVEFEGDEFTRTTPHILMNQQGVSEICFEETYAVPQDQTARSLFARLPHGGEYAQSLIECLATGYLVAVVESICIREMQMHIDSTVEVVVGRTVHIDHRGPIPPLTHLRLRGWVEGLGERSATFRVQAHDDHELVLDGTVTLVAVQRARIESRIATKLDALEAARGGQRA